MINIKLIIDGYDFTNCIIADTYQINKNDVYNTFVDGNYVTHRSIVRAKISGSVGIHLRDDEDISNWHALTKARIGSNAVHDVVLYVNNTGEQKLAGCFLNYAMIHKSKGNYDTANEFSLTIEEA